MQWWFLRYYMGVKPGLYRSDIEQTAGGRDEVFEESGRSDKAR